MLRQKWKNAATCSNTEARPTLNGGNPKPLATCSQADFNKEMRIANHGKRVTDWTILTMIRTSSRFDFNMELSPQSLA